MPACCEHTQWPHVAGKEAEAPGPATVRTCAQRPRPGFPGGLRGRTIKARLPAEALSKSDCDLFGLVTIKVWGDSYLSDAGPWQIDWTVQERTVPLTSGRARAESRILPPAPDPKGRALAQGSASPPAAGRRTLPARMPSLGWSIRAAAWRPFRDFRSLATPSHQVPGRSSNLRSGRVALQVTYTGGSTLLKIILSGSTRVIYQRDRLEVFIFFLSTDKW